MLYRIMSFRCTYRIVLCRKHEEFSGQMLTPEDLNLPSQNLE